MKTHHGWVPGSLPPSPMVAIGTSKLLQIGEYSLYGCVQSMEKVRLLHSERDTLLLSFNDAKVEHLYVYVHVPPLVSLSP